MSHLPTEISTNAAAAPVDATSSISPPRGQKRSRSPEHSGDAYGGAEDGTCHLNANTRGRGEWRGVKGGESI